MVAKNLKRIADHAMNIAKSVVFVVTGTDTRRAAEAEPLPEGTAADLLLKVPPLNGAKTARPSLSHALRVNHGNE